MPMFIPLIVAVAAASTVTSAIVAGIMIAGGALSTLGALTGDKDLSTFGSILGVVGGVGAFASGAASAASSSISAESTLNTGAALTETASTAAPAATDAADFAAMDSATMGTSGVVDSAAAGGAAAATPTAGVIADASPNLADSAAATASMEGTPGSTIDGVKGSDFNSAAGEHGADAEEALNGSAAGQDAATAPAKQPIKPLVGSDTNTPVTNGSPTVDAPTVKPTEVTPSTVDPADFAAMDAHTLGTPGAGVTPAAGGGGLIDKAGELITKGAAWAKQNPELLKVGAGLIGGAANNAAAQRRLQQQYELEWQQNQRARDRYNASIPGLKMPTYTPPSR